MDDDSYRLVFEPVMRKVSLYVFAGLLLLLRWGWNCAEVGFDSSFKRAGRDQVIEAH